MDLLMEVGDRVTRVFDRKQGEIIFQSSAEGYWWVRFDDGIECPVYGENLKLIAFEMAVG